MLTGRPPFKCANVLDTLEQVRTLDPVSPSRLQGRVPRDLETICLKCLRKEPAKRYASALNLVEDLERYLDGQPIRARPVPAWERLWKRARRRPAQAALAAATALAVLACAASGLFYGLYEKQRAAAVRKDGEAARARADAAQAKADTAQQSEAAALRQLERRRKVDQLRSLGEQAEARKDFAAAKEHWDQALNILRNDPNADDGELLRRLAEGRERVRVQVEKAAAHQGLLAARQEFLSRLRRFGRHRDQTMFHAFDFRPEDAADNAARIRREAPAALAEFGLDARKRPEAMAAVLASFRDVAETPEQFDQVATDCYAVLLAWAEAEAAGSEDGLRLALRLLEAAAALAEARHAEQPQAFHRRKARYLERLGDDAAALDERERACAVVPQGALDHFLEAVECYRQGRFPQASAACEEALRCEPNHYWAQYLKAWCNLKAGRHNEATVGLTVCLGLQPDFPWPLALRGMAYAQLGEFAAADRDFERALEQARDRPDGPALRAAVLTSRSTFRIRQGRWAEAERDLKAAIKEQPEAYAAYLNLSRAYQQRGDLDAAVEVMDQALRLQPDDTGLLLTRGLLHARRGDRNAALRGESASLMGRLFLLHAERSDRQTARQDFERVAQLEGRRGPSDRLARARVELARLRYLAGEYPCAVAECDAALAVRPQFLPAHRQRAEALLALGRLPEAGAALDRCLEGGMRSLAVLRARGIIHARLNEHEAAVSVYTQALALKRWWSTDVAVLRGWSYLEMGAWRPARTDFDDALRLWPQHVEALLGRAEARVRLGDVDGGTADAEAALRLQPHQRRVLLEGACIYARGLAELDERQRKGVEADAGLAYHCQERALELLRAALEKETPEEERAAFWREKISKESALVPLRYSTGMQQLARKYGGR
jgi:tetratricopeptide (TPR) repeat protein